MYEHVTNFPNQRALRLCLLCCANWQWEQSRSMAQNFSLLSFLAVYDNISEKGQHSKCQLWNSLQWPIYIINSVYISNNSVYTLLSTQFKFLLNFWETHWHPSHKLNFKWVLFVSHAATAEPIPVNCINIPKRKGMVSLSHQGHCNMATPQSKTQ